MNNLISFDTDQEYAPPLIGSGKYDLLAGPIPKVELCMITNQLFQFKGFWRA